MRKKKVLFHSNYCGVSTGFGGFIKELLTYLYKTDKYDLYLYSSGIPWGHPDLNRWPWKVYGAVPPQNEMDNYLNQFPINEREARIRLISYGAYNLDKVINEVKPDVYFGIEDFWGVDYSLECAWWNKFPCCINWTADSVPLLKQALEKANKINYHFVWAQFAEKEFKRLANELKNKANNTKDEAEKARLLDFSEAYNRVKTLRGTVNTEVFKKVEPLERQRLRTKHGITKDDFCVGFLSRNQLRKLIPNLIEGFKIFSQQNPKTKAKLILFTHFGEGWDIPSIIQELGVESVFATYKCRQTGEFFILPFQGQDIDNPRIKDSKSLVTVNLSDSLTTEQVNEWYNLLDCFCLPITSGGQERAIQEAKLCELITLTNAYSCGEDNCMPEAASIELDFDTHNREIGTNFRKANVYPFSIAKNLAKVYNMAPEQRAELGRKARKWVLDNFSIEVVGKNYEEFLDSLPLSEYNFDAKVEAKDPNAVIEDIEDNLLWVKQLYSKILKMSMSDNDQGVLHWLGALKNGLPREKIVEFFVKTAREENLKNQPPQPLEAFLDNNGKKRFLVVIKESIGDIINATALLESFKESYPDHDLYVACDEPYKDLFNGNPYVHKVLPWMPPFDSEIVMTGQGENKGYFDGYCLLTVGTQKVLNYLTNNNLSLKLD